MQLLQGVYDAVLQLHLLTAEGEGKGLAFQQFHASLAGLDADADDTAAVAQLERVSLPRFRQEAGTDDRCTFWEP